MDIWERKNLPQIAKIQGIDFSLIQRVMLFVQHGGLPQGNRHDIRNKLQCYVGFASLLQDAEDPDLRSRFVRIKQELELVCTTKPNEVHSPPT